MGATARLSFPGSSTERIDSDSLWKAIGELVEWCTSWVTSLTDSGARGGRVIMAETSSLPMQEGRGIFLRKATGLVREVSLFDAFVMNTLGMNVAVGGVFLFLQAPADFPGGSMLLAVIIGTLLMAFTLLWVYSDFAAAMPRSGGDYIFVSPALNPFLGSLLSSSQGMWPIFFC